MTTRILRGLCGLALSAAVASCSMAPGNSATDRIAAAAARRISYPRQRSADALVRAAVGTSRAPSPDFAVVEAEDLHAEHLVDPLARLVFRIHVAGTRSGFSSTNPITACYQAMFNSTESSEALVE